MTGQSPSLCDLCITTPESFRGLGKFLLTKGPGFCCAPSGLRIERCAQRTLPKPSCSSWPPW